jgi:hypothetical protein
MAPAIFNVPGGSDPGVPVPSLTAAITLAEGNNDTSNIINVEPGSYPVVDQFIAMAPTRTLTIVGQGQGVTITANQQYRVFEINANVAFENLTITGGLVKSKSADSPAQAGGLLIDGGQVTLSNVNVTGNKVQGADGSKGSAGAGSNAGDPGHDGGDAYGGGIYLAGGTLTLTASKVSSNQALAGNGGQGGTGGPSSSRIEIALGCPSPRQWRR